MITIIEFLDKIAEIWPYATKQEKQTFSDLFCKASGIAAVYSAYKQLHDSVTKRVGGNK